MKSAGVAGMLNLIAGLQFVILSYLAQPGVTQNLNGFAAGFFLVLAALWAGVAFLERFR